MKREARGSYSLLCYSFKSSEIASPRKIASSSRTHGDGWRLVHNGIGRAQTFRSERLEADAVGGVHVPVRVQMAQEYLSGRE